MRDNHFYLHLICFPWFNVAWCFYGMADRFAYVNKYVLFVFSSGHWCQCGGVRGTGGSFAALHNPRAVCGHPGLSAELSTPPRWNHRFLLSPHSCLPSRKLQTTSTGWDICLSISLTSFLYICSTFIHVADAFIQRFVLRPSTKTPKLAWPP